MRPSSDDSTDVGTLLGNGAAHRAAAVTNHSALDDEDDLFGDVGRVVGDRSRHRLTRMSPSARSMTAGSDIMWVRRTRKMPSRSASASSSRPSTACASGDVLFHERLAGCRASMATAISPRRATSNAGRRSGYDSRSDHALGDVDGLVADALEVGVHLDDRAHQPEVGGDGILEREKLDAQVVDFELELVDRRVAGRHLDRQIGLALQQRRHRVAHA